MGKKKVKPSAFGEFMSEFISKERRAGRNYPKCQWSQIVAPHWNKLSEDEKEKYKLRAKVSPAMIKTVEAKYTSHGIPIAAIEREQEILFEQHKYMDRKIRNMVEFAMQENSLKTKSFVFIMADYFYKTLDKFYSPAELALAKFSFRDGITKVYHTFIDPASVTLGYRFEAQERSEKVHHLPIPPKAFGERRYDEIYDEIRRMLGINPTDRFSKNNENRPCVFILKDKNEMISSILSQLSTSNEVAYTEQFDVFDLEILFNAVKNIGEIEPIRITVTNAFLERDRFDATANISCEFHEVEDVTRHCALSYVRRWFFEFCDHVCEKLGIDLEAGKHLPGNAGIKRHQEFESEGDDANSRARPKMDQWSNDDNDSTASSINVDYKELVESDPETNSD